MSGTIRKLGPGAGSDIFRLVGDLRALHRKRRHDTSSLLFLSGEIFRRHARSDRRPNTRRDLITVRSSYPRIQSSSANTSVALRLKQAPLVSSDGYLIGRREQ